MHGHRLTFALVACAQMLGGTSGAGPTAPPDSLPDRFDCAGEARGGALALAGVRVPGEARYTVDIALDPGAGRDGEDLRLEGKSGPRDFTVEAVEVTGISLVHQSGRTTTTLELALEPGRPSIIDDGTAFFFQDMECRLEF